MLAFSNARPTKIDPNWDFWFEIKPSGNPSAVSRTPTGLLLEVLTFYETIFVFEMM
jgi:hypothetical protein